MFLAIVTTRDSSGGAISAGGTHFSVRGVAKEPH